LISLIFSSVITDCGGSGGGGGGRGDVTFFALFKSTTALLNASPRILKVSTAPVMILFAIPFACVFKVVLNFVSIPTNFV